MEFAGFATEAQAREWRAQHGGWIFTADTGAVIWFRFGMTASQVMLHPATRGLSGKLI